MVYIFDSANLVSSNSSGYFRTNTVRKYKKKPYPHQVGFKYYFYYLTKIPLALNNS